jgi:lipid II:glycine glycyltransferase (peptidoglycan interpeptide bridge formation enzyme)
MLIREVLEEEKTAFNKLAPHPLQAWEWGQFREKLGLKVIRLGVFDDKKLVSGYQTTIHPIFKTKYTIAYLPKSPLPDKSLLEALVKVCQKENAIFLKIEPQVFKKSGFGAIDNFLKTQGLIPAKPIFSPYTLLLDLTKDPDELLAKMHPKTRYNIRLAQRHGVVVVEDNSDQAFASYLKLHFETTKRDGFYSHTPLFHQTMWQILKPAGIAHLLLAKYQGTVLAAWMLFVFNNCLYYPYGGSSRKYKEVMASYALMWQAIKFGRQNHCRTFDLWGIPEPNPSPQNPWYGFYRFKIGFAPQPAEFIGAYDLVLNQPLYTLYNLADRGRWFLLRLKSKLPF